MKRPPKESCRVCSSVVRPDIDPAVRFERNLQRNEDRTSCGRTVCRIGNATGFEVGDRRSIGERSRVYHIRAKADLDVRLGSGRNRGRRYRRRHQVKPGQSDLAKDELIRGNAGSGDRSRKRQSSNRSHMPIARRRRLVAFLRRFRPLANSPRPYRRLSAFKYALDRPAILEPNDKRRGVNGGPGN